MLRVSPGGGLRAAVALAAVLFLADGGDPTPAAGGKPGGSFTFAVISDTHTGGTKTTGQQVYRRILEMVNEEKPDLLVHCGDWIIAPTFDKAGHATADTFLAITSMLDSSIAFYPVLGNHEGDHEDFSYARSFYPVLGDSGWYSFDHGNAHFFVVENNSDAPDSALMGYRHCLPNAGINTPGSRQRRWLESDLKGRRPETEWTFGFGHRSYYGAEEYAGRKNVYVAREGEGAFCPFIEDAGVDVFFNGDQHCYTRTTPIRHGRRWEESDRSTVYLTVGGGGGRINRGGSERFPFPFLDDFPEDAYVTGTKTRHFFLLCTVDGPRFHADVIDTSGARIDSFTIVK